MLVLGLLLVLGAALITVGAIFDAGETATVEILGQVITTTAAGVFIAGLVTMLMFLIGVWAISASFGRARRKRAERKTARRDHRDSVARLEEERAALREENERLARQLSTREPATTGAGLTEDARTREAPRDASGGTTGVAPTGPTGPTGTTGATGPADTPGTPGATGRDPDTDGRGIDHHSDLPATDGNTASHARHRDSF